MDAIFNLSVEQLAAAIETYRAAGAAQEELDAIDALFHISVTQFKRSKPATAAAIGYHEDNLWKLFTGRYTGSLGNVREAVEALQYRLANSVQHRFVDTPVTEQIFQALNHARAMNAFVVILGDTGTSKTASMEEWTRRNNHGRTVYVKLPENASYYRLLELVAKASGVGTAQPSDDRRARIIRHMNRRRTLILDEAGHLYSRKRPDPRAFDFIKCLLDDTHCGLVMATTYYYWDLITTGPLHEHFEQLVGRVDFTLRIPRGRVFKGEIDAICRAYCDTPDPLMLSQSADAAKVGDGRLRSLFQTLDTAVQHAKRLGEPLAGKHMKAVSDWLASGGVWDSIPTV